MEKSSVIRRWGNVFGHFFSRTRVHKILQTEKEHSESANLRRHQHFNQKWSKMRIRIFGLIRIRIGCLSDLSQNVVDALSGWHQSFRQVWYKSAVYCMRNTNRCPKIPYFAMVKKMKKWSVIRNPHADPDHHLKLIKRVIPCSCHAFLDCATGANRSSERRQREDRGAEGAGRQVGWVRYGIVEFNVQLDTSFRRRFYGSDDPTNQVEWGVGPVGRGVPLPSRLGDLEQRHELPQQGRGQSPGRKRIFGIFWRRRTLLVERKMWLFAQCKAKNWHFHMETMHPGACIDPARDEPLTPTTVRLVWDVSRCHEQSNCDLKHAECAPWLRCGTQLICTDYERRPFPKFRDFSATYGLDYSDHEWMMKLKQWV